MASIVLRSGTREASSFPVSTVRATCKLGAAALHLSALAVPGFHLLEPDEIVLLEESRFVKLLETRCPNFLGKHLLPRPDVVEDPFAELVPLIRWK
jgi:hypothetical protein